MSNDLDLFPEFNYGEIKITLDKVRWMFMNIDEVIRLGEEAAKTESFVFRDLPVEIQYLYYALGAISIVALIIGKFLKTNRDGNQSDRYERIIHIAIGAPLIIGFAVTGINVLELNHKESKKQERNIEKWKDEVAYPFIESIPAEKKELIFVKIDPEITTENVGRPKKKYTKEIQETPLSISYKDDGEVVTVTDWMSTKMHLTTDKKPYVGFQVLEKDLGHGIDAGVYNFEVYLPDDYSFTDIK